jgi:hypothetical protein
MYLARPWRRPKLEIDGGVSSSPARQLVSTRTDGMRSKVQRDHRQIHDAQVRRAIYLAGGVSKEAAGYGPISHSP